MSVDVHKLRRHTWEREVGAGVTGEVLLLLTEGVAKYLMFYRAKENTIIYKKKLYRNKKTAPNFPIFFFFF